MDETDERVDAWEAVARHPLFEKCYEIEEPLIQSVLKVLDAQISEPQVEVATQAEEPVEWRILRAFTNGYTEGIQRGSNGRLDHS